MSFLQPRRNLTHGSPAQARMRSCFAPENFHPFALNEHNCGGIDSAIRYTCQAHGGCSIWLAQNPLQMCSCQGGRRGDCGSSFVAWGRRECHWLCWPCQSSKVGCRGHHSHLHAISQYMHQHTCWVVQVRPEPAGIPGSKRRKPHDPKPI